MVSKQQSNVNLELLRNLVKHSTNINGIFHCVQDNRRVPVVPKRSKESVQWKGDGKTLYNADGTSQPYAAL